MKNRRVGKVFLHFFLTFALAGGSACDSLSGADPRFALSGSEKRLELRGKIVSVDKDNQQITVDHEEVKDFMPAMTMPFTLKDEWAFEKLGPGDQIAAALIVDGPRAWLEDIVITKAPSDSSAGSSGAAASAKVGDEVPDFRLVNQDGKQISLHNYRGKALVLTFIYTRCPIPDYCTQMSNNFAQIEGQLQKDPQLRSKTHLLSISIDPEYDTPAVLRSYGAAHTGNYSEEKFRNWEFASGTKDEVKGIAQHFGLQYFQDSDQIVHGLRTAIIQPDGKVLKVYEGNGWKAEEVVEDLRKLLEMKPAT